MRLRQMPHSRRSATFQTYAEKRLPGMPEVADGLQRIVGGDPTKLTPCFRMPPVADRRQYDLGLFGATGFTGGLAARYLAANGPDGLRWALVGRNRGKLEAVRSQVEGLLRPGLAAPDLIEADAADAGAMAKVAGAAKVVITTVGPYALYGEPLVAACAATGTDF
jgi:hypothetical protein